MCPFPFYRELLNTKEIKVQKSKQHVLKARKNRIQIWNVNFLYKILLQCCIKSEFRLVYGKFQEAFWNEQVVA